MTLVNSLWSKSRGLTLQLTIANRTKSERSHLCSSLRTRFSQMFAVKRERRKHLHLHWSKRSQRGAHWMPLFVLAALLALVIWLTDCWSKGIESDLMRTVEDVASRMASVTVFSTLDARNGFWQIKSDYESSLLSGCRLESPPLLMSFSVPLKSFLLGIPVQ